MHCAKLQSDVSEYRIAADEAVKIAETSDAERQQLQNCFDQEIHAVRKAYENKVPACYSMLLKLLMRLSPREMAEYDENRFASKCGLLLLMMITNVINDFNESDTCFKGHV